MKILPFCLFLFWAACRGAPIQPGAAQPGQKEDAWDTANNPSHLGDDFIYAVYALPTEGEAPPPIPGDYWPTYRDSINAKWDSEQPSPVEKYARAFGKDVTQVMDAVSYAQGVKSLDYRKACTSDEDCSDQNDGSACAASYDGADKRCVPRWWGICHGWAPYALSEPAAKHSVKRNGVTFYPGDLQALMSLLYTDIDSAMLATRCELGNHDHPVGSDPSGRTIESSCRDMNAGSWHVLVTNKMGLHHQGFVLDQSANYEVWNQPGWKFKINNLVNRRLKQISRYEAIKKIGGTSSATQVMPSTQLSADATQSGSYSATESGTLHLRLFGTREGDGDLYVKRGDGVSLNDFDCVSDGWTSTETCSLDVQAGEELSWLVVGSARQSTVALYAAYGDSDAYKLNPDATYFWEVEMEFTFISEASPSRTASETAHHATSKRYSYVLETDGYQRILGGEWVGDSRGDHPDFVWWPVKQGNSFVRGDTAMISYDEVKSLNDEASR